MTDERWIEAVRSAARCAMVINHDASLDGPMALLILENMGKHIADLRKAQIDMEPLITAARKILRIHNNGQPKQMEDAVLLLRAAFDAGKERLRPCVCQGYGYCRSGCDEPKADPTPRTDNTARKVACVGTDGDGNYFHGVPVEFARQLERELTRLSEEYSKLARGEVFVHP